MHDKKGSWRSGEEGLEWLGIRICMRKRVRKRGKERESERMEKGDSEQREQRRLMKRGRRRKQEMPDEREMAGTKDIVCVP